MAWQIKFTAERGKTNLDQVTVGAGSSESHSDTISINIDATALTKGEALIMIDKIKARIFTSAWPAI